MFKFSRVWTSPSLQMDLIARTSFRRWVQRRYERNLSVEHIQRKKSGSRETRAQHQIPVLPSSESWLSCYTGPELFIFLKPNHCDSWWFRGRVKMWSWFNLLRWRFRYCGKDKILTNFFVTLINNNLQWLLLKFFFLIKVQIFSIKSKHFFRFSYRKLF